MKKRIKKRLILGYSIVFVLLIISAGFFFIGFKSNDDYNFNQITGNVVGTSGGQVPNTGMPNFGPSAADQACMKKCVTDAGCAIGDAVCSEKNNCQTKCNVIKPEQTAEEKCVETCTSKGCEEYDFSCQQKNQEKCDKECGMIKEPEAKSKEEQCIRDCVNLHSPNTLCKPSSEGEQGNDVCKMCAQQCVHLYEGPCLNEEKLEAAKQDCQTCEHCYGEPKMGDSGEGWDCIVSVECKDASSEFGDEPGTGLGVGQEGFVANVGEAIGNVVESIGDFFKGIFGGEKSSE